ncbi:hypothetical protein SISSUDRAFT_1051618 [Sistotremastrum suecicum HHB10207 ss-3]|uniref:Cleavage/polyadenylation specificity factor A subunit N-terminal domain-containing protein n=1 Tax=Sistotremastrum suecicum HHB10207 ss-3 TaxID=1314776 RepID=A0A166AFY1_9AGAM|nr:hypothetical protein SISSUDRAFT_1051618 [Sistotremastrum suecicum HHB10207 ss-3]
MAAPLATVSGPPDNPRVSMKYRTEVSYDLSALNLRWDKRDPACDFFIHGNFVAFRAWESLCFMRLKPDGTMENVKQFALSERGEYEIAYQLINNGDSLLIALVTSHVWSENSELQVLEICIKPNGFGTMVCHLQTGLPCTGSEVKSVAIGDPHVALVCHGECRIINWRKKTGLGVFLVGEFDSDDEKTARYTGDYGPSFVSPVLLVFHPTDPVLIVFDSLKRSNIHLYDIPPNMPLLKSKSSEPSRWTTRMLDSKEIHSFPNAQWDFDLSMRSAGFRHISASARVLDILTLKRHYLPEEEDEEEDEEDVEEDEEQYASDDSNYGVTIDTFKVKSPNVDRMKALATSRVSISLQDWSTTTEKLEFSQNIPEAAGAKQFGNMVTVNGVFHKTVPVGSCEALILPIFPLAGGSKPCWLRLSLPPQLRAPNVSDSPAACLFDPKSGRLYACLPEKLHVMQY